MDNIVAKIESFITKQIENFEKSPLKTSLKLILIYWIVKKVWEEVRSN